jgi:glucose/arabinose dehydrogenase
MRPFVTLRAVAVRVILITVIAAAGLAACSSNSKDPDAKPTTPPDCPSEETDYFGLRPQDKSQCRLPMELSTTEPLTEVALRRDAVVESPASLTFHPDDPGAWYVVDKTGVWYRVTADGSYEMLFDLRGKIATQHMEQGFFDAEFNPAGDKVYLSWSDPKGTTRIVEFEFDVNGDWLRADTGRVVLTLPQPPTKDTPIHNGGQMEFGPDGYLYIGVGDGGSEGEIPYQGLNILLGKILRIDPTPSADLPYTIPPDNPFVNDSRVRPEIYIAGVRNPWSFSFDKAGDMWIPDVGTDIWEEINFLPNDQIAGAHLGWDLLQGYQPSWREDPYPIKTPQVPLLVYAHDPKFIGEDGQVKWIDATGKVDEALEEEVRADPSEAEDTNCAVVGGYVYEGKLFPELKGKYIFSDFCGNEIRALWVDGAGTVQVAPVSLWSYGTDIQAPTGVIPGPDGEPWVLSFHGSVMEMVPPDKHPIALDRPDDEVTTDPFGGAKVVDLTNGTFVLPAETQKDREATIDPTTDGHPVE